MDRTPTDLLHGTLDVLILKTLTWGPRHGYDIARWIEDQTRSVLLVEDAALYKALHRLERGRTITAEWGMSESRRRAKFYALTELGRQRLRAEMRVWRQYAAAVYAVLEAT